METHDWFGLEWVSGCVVARQCWGSLPNGELVSQLYPRAAVRGGFDDPAVWPTQSIWCFWYQKLFINFLNKNNFIQSYWQLYILLTSIIMVWHIDYIVLLNVIQAGQTLCNLRLGTPHSLRIPRWFCTLKTQSWRVIWGLGCILVDVNALFFFINL